jgi:adenine-specific DNA-methyltransferase
LPIKYIGSKRRLVPVLGALLDAAGARTALDLFTGTTRVAQEFKRRGAIVTALDSATYSKVFADCYIATDGLSVNQIELQDALASLQALPGSPGYFTETFCTQARYFRPENGAKVDAVRNAIATDFAGSPLQPILLTSLIEAADRVDSTTGLQMAYLKQWAPRALEPLQLRPPCLLTGRGTAVLGDAYTLAGKLGTFDLAYLDPPYNQHRYFTNYHVWETLVRWDAPEPYGVARKRIDSRHQETKSVFNSKRQMPTALKSVIGSIDARILLLSYNNEAWISPEELLDTCRERGHVEILEFDSKRYVGAQIGVYDPKGNKVGKVSHLRNLELVAVCGAHEDVVRTLERYRAVAPR